MGKFAKLADLVDKDITVIRNNGYKWQSYDAVNKKMLESDVYIAGYRKMYSLDTDAGNIKLGEENLGKLFVQAAKGNVSDISDMVYAIKSNGKEKETDIEEKKKVRYYFNIKGKSTTKPTVNVDTEEEIPLEDIPF